jgi:hypothetical protein
VPSWNTVLMAAYCIRLRMASVVAPKSRAASPTVYRYMILPSYASRLDRDNTTCGYTRLYG